MNIEIIKNAARLDEWYKRGGVFKEAYDEILKAKEGPKPKPPAKKKGTKK